jgi:hypothetical protein
MPQFEATCQLTWPRNCSMNVNWYEGRQPEEWVEFLDGPWIPIEPGTQIFLDPPFLKLIVPSSPAFMWFDVTTIGNWALLSLPKGL